jgi:hypothetical protein
MGNHPNDDVSALGGKRLRALDPGDETLELDNLLEVAIGMSEGKSHKGGGEGGAVPPAAPHRMGGGVIGARERAWSAGSGVGDGSHAGLLDFRGNASFTRLTRTSVTRWTLPQEPLKLFGLGH